MTSCAGCEGYVNRATSTCRYSRPACACCRKVSPVSSTNANAEDVQIFFADIRYGRRQRVTRRAYNLTTEIEG